MNDNFFMDLIGRGRLLRHEDFPTNTVMKFRLFSKIFHLTFSTAQDLDDSWDYEITDKFGQSIICGQYTRVV
jgi:hypothetical protein